MKDELYGFSKKDLTRLLGNMILYRRFEEQAEQAYAIGKIGGFCHLHIGQEGVAEGCIAPLRPDDYVVTAYREHTQALAKGAEPKLVMSELYGRASGVSSGNGGSMHIYSAEHGFLGGHGIVGAQTALATGVAFASKYRKDDRVTIVFMGDAAVNQGAFYESMNMAAIWDLPIIYVVENNDYGMGTKFERVSNTPILERSKSMGVPATQVNGQDVLATFRHFESLIAGVRAGGGPQFVDVLCYRFKGHSISDPSTGVYRSKEEVDEKIENADPIRVLAERMKRAGLIEEGDVSSLDAEAKRVCQEAADFAEDEPFPDPSQLYQNVYAEVNPHGRLFLDGRPESPNPSTIHGQGDSNA
jgi:pyruvate dehydrogenase E1 component alpha subunit